MKNYVFLFSLFAALTAFAENETTGKKDETSDSSTLSSVVIKDDVETKSVYRATSDRIEKTQAEDVKEALKGIPDVFVGGGQKSAQKIYVRGVEDLQLNVTLDGARQSGYLFHHQGRLSIDTELLKQIDVEAGTGDALAGPGALGGAVRFVTKDPSDLLLPGQNIGALAKLGYGTNADMKNLSLGVFGLASDNFEYLLYTNMAETGDYRAGGGGSVSYTAGKPKSYLAKLVYTPNETQKVSFSANSREDNARRSMRNHFGDLPFNPPNDQKFGNDTYTLQYSYAPDSPWVQINSEVYSTKTHLSQETTTSFSEAETKSVGGTVSNKMRFANSSLTFGTDFNVDEAESLRATGNKSETGKIFGVFTQYRHVLGSLSLSGGLRYDNYELKDVFDNSLNDHHISPNIRAVYAFNDVWSAWASWSQAFKGATPMEAYVMSGVTNVVTTPNLKGTTAETSELGVQSKKDNLVVKLTGYYTVMKDVIQVSTNRNTGVMTRSNAKEEQKFRGVNLNADYLLGAWVFRGGYAHNKAEIGDEPIGSAVSTTGSSFGDRFTFGADYRLTDWNLVFSWDSLVVLTMTDVPKTSKEQPGYDVHDISMQWVPSERLRVGVAVTNIFDKKYVAQGTPYQVQGGVNTIYEQGVDGRFSISYLF